MPKLDLFTANSLSLLFGMTFYIKELVFNATAAAWDAIEDDINIRRHLFLLRNKINHNWSRKNHTHDYSNSGLFFIRPVCSQASSAYSWFTEEDWVVNPRDLLMTENVTMNIAPLKVQTNTCLSPEAFEAECPLNVLRFAKMLSQIIQSNVVYYDACYWGGMVEYELAWIFGEKEEVIVQLASSKDQKQICTINANSLTHSEGNTLRSARKNLGVKYVQQLFSTAHTKFQLGRTTR